MIYTTIWKRAWILLVPVILFSCSGNSSKPAASTDLTHFQFTVEEAPDWTGLFQRDSGWFGADGIFALPMSGVDHPSDTAKTVLLFSDTMIGDIVDGKPRPGYSMIHNSVALLKGDRPDAKQISFHWDSTAGGKAESLFIPKTPKTQPGDYYWLGDGFVNQELGGNTYIFGYRIRDIKDSNTFGFEHIGSTLITLPQGSTPPYKDMVQTDFPFFELGAGGQETLAFGSGIFVNTKTAGAPDPDGYVYVYGIRGKDKNLVAARVLPKSFMTFSEWRFWDGHDWVPELSKVTNLTNHLSNELSVSALPDGRYALVFQEDGISSKIGIRLGSSPVGPFGPIITLFDCKDALHAKNLFAYNAKAHPSLSAPGELLISYNVNSFDFKNDIELYPHLYRPRFIRVKF